MMLITLSISAVQVGKPLIPRKAVGLAASTVTTGPATLRKTGNKTLAKSTNTKAVLIVIHPFCAR
jgi:hypothetical protein